MSKLSNSPEDGDLELCNLVEVQLKDELEYGEYSPLGHQGRRPSRHSYVGQKARLIAGLLIVLVVIAYIYNNDSTNAISFQQQNPKKPSISEAQNHVSHDEVPSDTESTTILHDKTDHPISSPSSSPTSGVDFATDDIEELKKIWGKWHFWDGEPESRPKEDYLSAFPNKDCPADNFPETAWQGDGVYVNHLIDSGSELVARAKEAIYTEYGWGPKSKLNIEQQIARKAMFKIDVVDDDAFNGMENGEELLDSLERGGWTTKSSFHALTKRLLHAMMTNDNFTVVMGGDSAAAGHGNHFLQSYMMQFDSIMEPIFARLGMKLITRNIANDKLGTMQNALGSASLYGDEVDIILWDSSLTEGDSAFNLFCRQALLGGKRPPVLWSTRNFSILKDLHIYADADIMEFGTGMAGVQMTESIEQVETLPWATRYLKCHEENKDLCNYKKNRFRTRCWVNRDDVIPLQTQREHAPKQFKKNPGFRVHQLTGRVLAFTILDALQDALGIWSEETISSGHPLSDEYWHITDHYENIQKKVRNLDVTVGKCNLHKDELPERVCTTPLQGRTEFTPRANPKETSITSIIKRTADGYVPSLNNVMLYDGPDVANPALMIPSGEIDVRTIVGLRRKLMMSQEIEISAGLNSNSLRKTGSNEIIPGNGWEVNGSMPGNCDGTSTGICGRLRNSDCLLYGHMDARGGILGNAHSGWLVMNLGYVSEGLIILKIETSHEPEESTMIDATENDGSARTDMIFDYAINGQITSLTNTEFEDMIKRPQKSVEILTIMDDPGMTRNGGAQDIEVAIRLRNCGSQCTFRLTHVYWA